MVHKHTVKTYTQSKINNLKINYCQIQPNSLILLWLLNDRRNNFLNLQDSMRSLPKRWLSRERCLLPIPMAWVQSPSHSRRRQPTPQAVLWPPWHVHTHIYKCKSGYWNCSVGKGMCCQASHLSSTPVPTWLKGGTNSPKLSSNLHIHTMTCIFSHTHTHK